MWGIACVAGNPCVRRVLNYSKSGACYWIEMEIVPVKDPNGWVTHWVSVERDVTARRQAEEMRRSLEHQLNTGLERRVAEPHR